MREPLSMSTFLALAVCQEFWYVRYCRQPKPCTSTVGKLLSRLVYFIFDKNYLN